MMVSAQRSTVRKLTHHALVIAVGLSTSLTGLPLPQSLDLLRVKAAEANNTGVIRISESGIGVKKRLKLGLNKAMVIDLPADAHDILVADPTRADAVTRTARRIYLFGKSVGQTNIFIFGVNGQELVSLELEVERDITGLEANLRRFIPESDIHVEIVSDNIVLTGTVKNPQDSARAIQLANAFLNGGEATTRNISASSPSGNDGSVALWSEERQKSSVVNMLTIEGDDQVTLKVTVAEVSRQVLKQLGFNGSMKSSGNTGSANVSFANPTNLGTAVAAAATGQFSGNFGDLGLTSYVNAMEQAGVMRTLAEPSLTAISGEQAKFYVGGEFRLAAQQTVKPPKGDDPAEVSRNVETVDYGIELNFKPVVLSPGRISLKIETNVSEPTFEGSAATANGYMNIYPGSTYLSVRRREASTTVELPSGGSIVIAGLVQDNVRQAMSGLPGISKVPVFGTLFRSKDFIRNETELVIIATPYLVRPTSRAALARPDDNFNPTGDGPLYFMNRVNQIYSRSKSEQSKSYQGNVGFIYK